MIWVRENKVWYSADVIKKIKDCTIKVIQANACSRCDGCGYNNKCTDNDCGTYQAYKILQIIEEEQ